MVKTNMDKVIEGAGLGNLQETARQLLDLAEGSKIWLFEGEMGSGKTTLIRAICLELNINDNVTSPTFSIINEYMSDVVTVYHFDFYRVKTLAEALDAGVEDYFYTGNFCFIEWPDIIRPVLPSQHVKIIIDTGSGEKRKYKLQHYGSN
jgi:tRNA threonylcarbamoyladenosine biosynthesis protein TsaE